MKLTPRIYLVVGLGSMLGTMSRYGVSLLILALPGQSLFPWASLLANTVGSLLMGFYASLSAPDGPLSGSPILRHFMLSGFCGGFTSFSIFSLESVYLLHSTAPWLAAVNISASLILWLLTAWLGWHLAIRLYPR